MKTNVEVRRAGNELLPRLVLGLTSMALVAGMAYAVQEPDTSTSIRNDIAAIRAAIDRAGHPALLLVDCICSMGCERFEFDEWGVDVAVGACQKGLMVPPGLGFVWFSDKAAEVQKTARCVTHYWNWAPRSRPVDYSNHWDGTAPTKLVF